MTAMHWILLSIAVVLVVFDIVLAQTNWLPTISKTAWHFAARHPILPFATGVVCGHLFWQN